LNKMKSGFLGLALLLVCSLAFAGEVAVVAAPATQSTVLEKTEKFLSDRVSIEPFMDYVFERDLTGGVTLENMGWYGSKVNLKINDNVVVSPFLAGVSGADYKNSGVKFSSDNSLGYGVDTKVTVPTSLPVDTAVVAGWRGTRSCLDVNVAGIDNPKFDYNEWYIEPQVSKTFTFKDIPGKFTPVLGVRYSDVYVGKTTDGLNANISAKDNVGMTVGLKYDVNDTFAVAVNGKLIDQKALVVSGVVKF
jgi:hypothetical protein